MTATEERRALNESAFRRANEHLEEKMAAVVGEDGPAHVPFICECPRQSCTQVVLLTLDEYERVRGDPSWGLAVPGHEDLEVERVVERNDRFFVTEKLGRAREVQVEEDPRSRATNAQDASGTTKRSTAWSTSGSRA